MAAVATFGSTSMAMTQFITDEAQIANLKRYTLGLLANPSNNISFDPSKHLSYTPPSKVYSMAELGYPENRGVSPIGVSEAFSLFSTEAIQRMRSEVLCEKVFKEYKYSSELAQCQLRGYAAKCAPFVYDAWKNPETLAIISNIAGVDLVTAMDFEIGHINISISTEEKNKGLNLDMDNENQVIGPEDNDPIVDWHTDSYPFVCVTMLSDCTNMRGGETALRKGNGEVVKVRGPQMVRVASSYYLIKTYEPLQGSAVILQGRYIEHQALRALGAAERITMVTSFRPRASHTKDDTVLTTVRPISNLSELYHQFAEYRFEMLQDRFRDANRLMRDQQRAGRPLHTLRLKQFIRQQIEFLEHMDKEIVEDDKVVQGAVDDSHLISKDLKLERLRKRGLVPTN